MINRRLLKKLAEQNGTPLFVVDHDQLRRNYSQFKRYLPRIQAYYAVKANSDPAIVKTFYDAGASFDVASMPEFRIVYEYIKDLPDKERQAWIWDKIIYANPTKAEATLQELNQYKPLVTYDNYEEIKKIKRHAPLAGLALRIKVPNTGAMVELSSKFGAAPGEAVDMILAADKAGLVVEGLSFHVGSQTTNFQNYVAALELAANLFKEARARGYTKMNLLDIGGGFPAPYDDSVKPFRGSTGSSAACFRRTSRYSPSRAGLWSPPPPSPSPGYLARPCAMGSSVTISTTASITPSPASFSTTATTT